MRQHRSLVAVVGLALLTSPGCVVGPALPGVVEPGAAVSMRFDPAGRVTPREETASVPVSSLLGRVLAVDSAEFVLRVRAGELANGRRARVLEGRSVRVPRGERPDVTILAGDARSSEVSTFAVIGGFVAGALMLAAALSGG